MHLGLAYHFFNNCIYTPEAFYLGGELSLCYTMALAHHEPIVNN